MNVDRLTNSPILFSTAARKKMRKLVMYGEPATKVISHQCIKNCAKKSKSHNLRIVEDAKVLVATAQSHRFCQY